MQTPPHIPAAGLRQIACDLRNLFDVDPTAADELLGQLGAPSMNALLRSWQLTARPKQLRPADCKAIWLRQAGRGEGKTRSAAEETLDVCEDWGETARIILCSKTIGDVRKVMIKGADSGLEACARRRGYEVNYVPSHATVYHPSGAQMLLSTSEKPDGPRGLQCNYFWADEISSWMNARETFSNIIFAWRLPCPGDPKAIITTTPKPNEIMLMLLRHKEYMEQITVTRASTFDNRANLSPGSLKVFESVYAGTRLGKQELDGEMLDHLGKVFHQDIIHKFRVQSHPDLTRRVVSVDPSISDKQDADEAGVVVVGTDGASFEERECYVLADRTLGEAKFSDWAMAAVRAFVDFECDAIVAELNQGGSGVIEAIQVAAATLSTELGYLVTAPVIGIWAQKSKKARAEPIGALYEQGRVHHLGIHTDLETEISTWVVGMKSPNRMDALVHGLSHLFFSEADDVGPLSGYLAP